MRPAEDRRRPRLLGADPDPGGGCGPRLCPMTDESQDTAAGSRGDIDVKPRSRAVTDGIHAAPSRGMLRAVGFVDEDFAKPQIGVGSSWNEITPCNL